MQPRFARLVFASILPRALPYLPALLVSLLLMSTHRAGAQFHVVESVIHSFDDGAVANDGKEPYDALIQGSDGNFYGTTQEGGSTVAIDPYRNGYGTAFKMTPAGQITILHSFGDGSVLDDGRDPLGALVQGSDGNFYGTTGGGGSTISIDPNRVGWGTVFKMTPLGQVTILHSFSDGSVPGDGQYAAAPLIQASDGAFYGTTEDGGSAGFGTVYKITASGTYTLLHSFQDGTVADDGEYPVSALLQAADGNFYGPAQEGGSTATPGSRSSGDGVVFKMTPAGGVSILHSFGDGTVPNDGIAPLAALIQGTDGSFYGTTYEGGAVPYGGTAFKITPAGTVTILHSFGMGGDGASPRSPLLQGTDGNFYGLTAGGGAVGQGTIFRMTPTGTVTVFHSFTGESTPGDGAAPQDALIQGNDGDFYGTTESGGSAEYGTVFKLFVPIGGPPPVLTSFTPLSGPPGTVVTITGQSLSEFTAIRFHDADAAMASANAAGTQITVAVPITAISGKIRVTTPGGSTQTALPFTVTPSPTPAITSLSPASGITGTGVTITGTNFSEITGVAFSGVAAAFTVVSPTQITATVPGAAVTGVVTVTNSGGTATGPTPFTVTGGAPIPLSFAPASGPVGTVVTITGQRLAGVTAVRFNGANASVFSAGADGTQITVTVPSGALPGQIEVTTPLGSAQTPQPFIVTMTAYPTITGFTPSSGPVGTPVTITGTNLAGTTVVGFQGQHATSFTVNATGTQITTVVPAGAQAGPVAVLTNGMEAKSAMTFTVTP